jgi:tungsten cofactor oxidoreducase radical SAM maturase
VEIIYIKIQWGDNMSLKKLYLELTDKCNLNCKMCYRKSWQQDFCDMKEELLKKLSDELKLQGELKEIVIGGIGEPTYSEHFKKAIMLFKDYKLTVTTNGTLIDDHLSEHLVKYVDVVTISIDGLHEMYNEIRGTDLEMVMNNIKTLNRVKRKHFSKTPVIEVQFVLSSENVGELFKVMDLARELGADKFIISNVIPQGEENKNTILYSRYENKNMKSLFEKLAAYSMHKGINVDLPNCELKTLRRCDFIEGSAVFICACGDVAPCYRFSHNYTEYVFGRKKEVCRFSFGNIEYDTLMNIWNSKNYLDFRKRILHNRYPSCTDCDFVEGCTYVNSAEIDCYALSPSCGDCLWNRKLIQCP